jgi:hypothetical protein
MTIGSIIMIGNTSIMQNIKIKIMKNMTINKRIEETTGTKDTTTTTRTTDKKNEFFAFQNYY